MLKLGDYLDEPFYIDFVHRNYAFAFDNKEVLANHRADDLYMSISFLARMGDDGPGTRVNQDKDPD